LGIPWTTPEATVSEIERLLRRHVAGVPAYVTARSRYRGGILLDANENSLGPSAPDVHPDLHRYPDPRNGELRSALATWLEVPGDRLWLGNGSDEVIDLLIRVLVDTGSAVAVVEPSYGVYAQRVEAHGALVRGVRLDERFDLDVEATVAAADECTLLFLCSPNNPTGNLLSSERVLEVVRRTRCLVAVDEAYVEFAEPDARSVSLVREAGSKSGDGAGTERLAVIRTFSKAWGLAGARVGYLAGAPELVDAMNRVGLPYPLSLLSAQAAQAALKHAPAMERARDLLVAERRRLEQTLIDMGLRTLPSDANFVLFFTEGAAETQRRLADDHGVIVRDRSDMKGLAGGLRVTVGTAEENDRFLEALREVMA
jgi:histidinol-phosphate aminotransferase